MLKFVLILNILLISGTANLAHASEDTGLKVSHKDTPLTGQLVRNGVAIYVPDLNVMLALQAEGRALVEINPQNYSFKCIDPVNPCVIR